MLIAVVVLLVVGGAFFLLRGTTTAPTTNEFEPQATIAVTPTSTAVIEQQVSPTVATTAVAIENFAFNPKTLNIKAGSAVTFTNNDDVAHTATADDGSFDTGLLSKGQSKTITFDKKGTYPYFCTPHPKMRATITVE